MKKLVFLFLVFSAVASAQNINQYKYVVVPESYEFLGETNEYQLNALTKFLLEKYGFNTLMKSEDRPQQLQANPCLALNTKVINNSGLFVTKLVIQLSDCNQNVVFKSKEGRSRDKDYKTAYQAALRDAFTSLDSLDYKFSEKLLVEDEASPTKPAEVIVSTIPKKAMPEQENRNSNATDDKMETEKVIVEEDKPEIAEKPVLKEKANTSKNYLYKGNHFILNKNENGFSLQQKDSPEPFALLIESGDKNSFIYNSLTHQGIAYFDAQGNLVVEYYNRLENQKVELIYQLKN